MNKGILNLVLIGARSTGKTTYLQSLTKGKDSLNRTGRETIEYLDTIDEQVLANGKAEATAATHKVLKFRYGYDDKHNAEFTIDDYDGNFTETVFDEDLNTQKEREKLKQSIEGSEGCIFLFPYEKEKGRLKKFVRDLPELIDFAHNKTKDKQSKSPIPATIMVSKWDVSKYFQDDDETKRAEEYIQGDPYLNEATQLINDNFIHTQIVVVSSLKEYNILKPIKFSLDKTYEYWLDKANEYEKETNKQEYFKFLKEIRYDIRDISSFDAHLKRLHKYEKIKKIKNLTIAVIAIVMIVLVISYIAKQYNHSQEHKWMKESELCLKSCKGKKGLIEVERLIAQESDMKLVKNISINNRIDKLYDKKSSIHRQLDKDQTVESLRDTMSIDDIVALSSDAFKYKNITKNQIESNYPDYFETKKGVAILNSLTQVNNISDFEEILNEDVRLFIKRKEKYIKIYKDIEDSATIDSILQINFVDFDSFEGSDKALIINSINKKINQLVRERIEEKPINKLNTLAIKEWAKSIESLKKTEIPQINYRFHISKVDEKYINETKSEANKIANILANGINNVSLKIIGYEENSIGFECTFFGGSDEVVVEGFVQNLLYTAAHDCKDNSILFKDKISLKAKRYNVTVYEYGLLHFFDEKTFPLDISFTKHDIYNIFKGKSVSKIIDSNRIELVFKRNLI